MRDHRSGFLLPSVLCLGALLALGGPLFPERLPIRSYTVEDGLASDSIKDIFRDSRGYLWIATILDGLSRFDGERFVNYGEEDGLPHARVLDLLEARDGTYWVATHGGLARFVPARAPGRPAFERVPLPGVAAGEPVRALFEDRAGRIWVSVLDRVVVLTSRDGRFETRSVRVGYDFPSPPRYAFDMAESEDGSLWAATERGIARRLPDGRWILYPLVSRRYPFPLRDEVERNTPRKIRFDQQGNLWIAAPQGVIVFRPGPPEDVRSGLQEPLADRAVREGAVVSAGRMALPRTPGGLSLLPREWSRQETNVVDLHLGPDGRMWLGKTLGTWVWDGERLTPWGPAQGLPAEGIEAVCDDERGNVWIGTESKGLLRIARAGFTTYGVEDGLVHDKVGMLFEHGGEIWAVSDMTQPFGLHLHRFRDGRFTRFRVNVPGEIGNLGWGWNQILLQDRDKAWWMPTGDGLLRFPPATGPESLATTRPTLSGSRDGIGGDEMFRVYEDSRGDLWVGHFGRRVLSRKERATGRFRSYGTEDGIPVSVPTAFAEDRAGNLWIGLYISGILRFRNGRFERFTSREGAPAGLIYKIHLDRAGRLWFASGAGGVARVDDPDAPRPRFVSYTRRQGLAGNAVRSLAEDRWGRMYFGTTRGLDRLDPRTGQIRHFTAEDGFPNTFVQSALTDRDGHLWFGTYERIARFDPGLDPPAPSRPPRIWITGARVDGVPYPVSELGDDAVAGLEIPPGRHELQVDFFTPEIVSGEPMRYQYQLAEASADWSPPADRRTVTYARLPAGRLRFLVRAVTADGVVSLRPAVLSFVVHPPVWRRWWFLTLAALLLASLATAVYRWRVAQLLAVERMRTGITRDLHDDLGSSLSRISILSEVARQRVGEEPAAASRLLSSIGDTSRELMESLSESIWAIDPARDDLKSFVTRVRRFAGDLLEGRGIAWHLAAPAETDLPLSPVARRQLYLIVKEALHNVVKHAEARSVDLSVALAGRRLAVEIADDGRGFDLARVSGEGHGLRSLRSRAESLGGRLAIDSAPGQGTRVRVEVGV